MEYNEIFNYEQGNVKYAFSKRNVNAKNIDDIKKVLEKFDYTTSNLIYTNQVHGNNVKVVNENSCLNEEFDALVTNKKNVPLMIFTADCVPLIFFDNNKEVIALAHAGWKGTFSKISQNVVEIMRDVYNCSVKNINVVIGPHITLNNYEVSKELVEKFAELNIPNYYKICDKKYYLDLATINIQVLENIGILSSNILNSNFCTVDNNDKFFSYRKDNGTENRIGTIIELS